MPYASLGEFLSFLENKKELVEPHKKIVEGFANYEDPGEYTLWADECPESYKKCEITGRCIKVCKNCKVNNSGRSFEFNEFDPCFPNGVYDGIDNYWNTQCTCGKHNQYCSDKKNDLYDIFTRPGSYIVTNLYFIIYGENYEVNNLIVQFISFLITLIFIYLFGFLTNKGPQFLPRAAPLSNRAYLLTH